MAGPISRLLAPALVVAGLISTGVAVAGLAGSWGETRSVAAGPPGNDTSATPGGSPAPTSAPSTVPSTVPSTPAPAGQTPAEFLAALARATKDHDSAFLLGHLHAEVLAVYGRRQCTRHLRTIAPIDFDVQQVHKPGTFTWSVDGISARVSDAIAVDVRYTSGGTTAPATVHLVATGPTFAWFTDCGRPLRR